MGPSGPSLTLYLLLTVPSFLYAGYWAFSIRHALAVPLYRRQAFGIGFIVLAIWATLLVFVELPGNPTGLVENLTQLGAFYFLFFTLLYWIDASVLSSRRSDPLLRDTLHWSRVRLVVWAVLIISTVLPIGLSVYVFLSGDPALVAALNAGTIGGPVFSDLMNGVVFNLPIVVPICGLIYLPAAAVRSKFDRNLRRHFAWFVPVSVVLMVVFFGPFATGPTEFTYVLTSFLVVLTGYTLYRSAKALVPLNMISVPTSLVGGDSPV